jgi:hypothetical protein
VREEGVHQLAHQWCALGAAASRTTARPQ